MSQALVLIDIQRDYFPGGRMELSGPVQAAENAAKVLSLFRDQSWPVFHVQHIANRPGATFFLPGTEGADIQSLVRPIPSETVVVKHFPNSFRETPLASLLQAAGVTQLTVCGMMTHMCVDATVRAAFDLGFAVTVLHDACATRDLSFAGATIPASQVHGSFLAALGAVYAKVLGLDEYLHAIAA